MMGQYLDSGDFVGRDNVDSRPVVSRGRAGILLRGEIGCRGRIVIGVEKFLEILERLDGDAIVETRWYTYNVRVRGKHNIFRYDNQHPEYLHIGHHDEHHKHVFDSETGEELGTVWISSDGWPHLSEVIDEARDWRHHNISTLSDPNGFPELAKRGELREE